MLANRHIRVCGLFAIVAATAFGQNAGANTAGEIHVTLGRHAAPPLDLREGLLTHPGVLGYLQALTDRLAGAANAKAPQVQVPHGWAFYARLTPQNVLYISAALLERIDSEAELAGLLTHQLAHVRGPQPAELVCVLASPSGKWGESQRAAEHTATESALPILKTLGYDPSALLDLLSKLAYEHPAWAREIVPEDLLSLRAGIENDPLPDAGYLVVSSEYLAYRARLSDAMGRPWRPTQERPTLRKAAMTAADK